MCVCLHVYVYAQKSVPVRVLHAFIHKWIKDFNTVLLCNPENEPISIHTWPYDITILSYGVKWNEMKTISVISLLVLLLILLWLHHHHAIYILVHTIRMCICICVNGLLLRTTTNTTLNAMHTIHIYNK